MDILDQARFVTVEHNLQNNFHTIVVRFQVRSSMVCYGLVQLNTTFTRLTGHLQGLHTVPPTFVLVMLELSHIGVCFDIKLTRFDGLASQIFKLSHQVVPAALPAHQGRQSQQVEVIGGPIGVPWWPFLYSRLENLSWGFFWRPSSSLATLCSKYSVASRWQQVVSCVFCCVRMLIIHKFFTDIETMSGCP